MIEKIISGEQTGVDRAALDVALYQVAFKSRPRRRRGIDIDESVGATDRSPLLLHYVARSTIISITLVLVGPVMMRSLSCLKKWKESLLSR